MLYLEKWRWSYAFGVAPIELAVQEDTEKIAFS